jgi:hypothetical protein
MHVLHLYAQDSWHDPAYIVGSRQALQALRDGLDVALRGDDAQVQVMVNDGEGHTVHVTIVDEALSDRLNLPYIDCIARDSNGADALQPWQLSHEPCEPSA